MYNLNKEYWPNVVNVHRLVSYISLNKEIKKVPHCPNCMMPEFWNAGAKDTKCVFCYNCSTWPKIEDLVWLEKDAFVFLLTQLPLKHGGTPVHTAYSESRRRCYADLKTEELLELDYLI